MRLLPWKHFVLAAILACLTCGQIWGQGSQRRPRVELLREIDLEEGRERLKVFRNLWIEGDYSTRFELQFIPRRGEPEKVTGTLWGSNLPEGPVSLLKLNDASAHEFYLRNGPEGFISTRNAQARQWNRLPELDWLRETAEGFMVTPFDLMMPYIYWNDWEYDGVTKIRGRIAHSFFMIAPEDFRGNPENLGGVLVYLDEDFNAMLKAEYLDGEGNTIKTFRLLDLKKVDGIWLPKTIDFMDEKSRNKTRFRITDAAMGLEFFNHPLSRGELPAIPPEIPSSFYSEIP